MKNLFPKKKKNHDFCLIPTGKVNMKRDSGIEKGFLGVLGS